MKPLTPEVRRERAVGYALCYFDEHGSQCIFDDVNRGVLTAEQMATEFAAFAIESPLNLKFAWREFENGLRRKRDGDRSERVARKALGLD